MVPQVGQRIGPYEILGRLGSGGMGLVYSAWDSRLQRDVAIKILREEYTSPGMRQRFLQEARAASRLNQANICTIFDIGEQEGDPYLVMELLKGETTRSRISRGPVSASDLCLIAIEVAEALIVAHGRGIIHRDIKPANIMLVDRPAGRFQTKVLDFGLAKVERGDGADTRIDLTSAGTTVGTVAYMSPEQARGESLDARSDLFSLGTVLYEMATGELPFQGATSALVFVQLLSHPPESVREFNPDIPKDLEKIILKLLEKKRSDRFQSAAEVLEAFNAYSLKRGGKGFFGSRQPAKSWGRDKDRSQDPPTLPPRRPVRPDLSAQIKDAEQRSVPRVELNPVPPPVSTPSPAMPVLPEKGKSMQDSAEMFLRPVKRVLPGDSSKPAPGYSDPAVPIKPKSDSEHPLAKPEPHPSAFALFQAASTAAHRVSGTELNVKKGIQSSSGNIAASSIIPGLPRPPARSSSGLMPIAAATPVISKDSASNASPTATTPTSDETPAAGSEKRASGSHTSRLVSTRVPARKFNAPELRYEDANSPEGASALKSNALWIMLLVLIAIVAASIFGYKMFHKGLLESSAPVSLLLVSLDNHTGDTTLDGVFQSGMLLDLQQSAHLSVRGRTDLFAGAKSVGVTLVKNVDPTSDDARKIATAVGANAIAFGSIDKANGQYTVSLHVFEASSGNDLKDASETATSREQVSDAIDRLSSDIRLGLGESGDSVSSNLVPMARDASSNPDALAAYAQAEDAKATGDLDTAADDYQRATTVDGNFTQAYIELADIRRQQHAEVEAAAAALHAQDTSSNSSVRTQKLAHALYALITQGDSAQSINVLQDLCSTYTADTEAHVLLALAQRLAGHYSDALATAQGILAQAPYNDRALANAELSMIALGQFSDAQQMESRSAAANLAHPAIAALIVLLSPETPLQSAPTQPQTIADKITYASALDAGGQFIAGAQAWQDAIERARADSGMASSASYSLAHEALDHALINDCTTANSLLQFGVAMPNGSEAQYFGGIAYALCNNPQGASLSQTQLTASSKQSSAATKVLLPVLTAVLQWKSGDATDALTALHASTADTQWMSDSLWLAPYLSAVIQINQKHNDQAFAALDPMVNPDIQSKPVRVVYPQLYAMAELQAGRAADARNSSKAYQRFATLWTNADPSSPLLAEAKQAGNNQTTQATP